MVKSSPLQYYKSLFLILMNAFSSEKCCRLQWLFDIRPTGTQISLMALFQGARPDHVRVDSLSCFPGEVGSFVHSMGLVSFDP